MQEHWSGLPFPSPVREREVAQSCPTLRDPMDCSPPGSSVHGIFQARVLEWGAIAFSGPPVPASQIICGSSIINYSSSLGSHLFAHAVSPLSEKAFIFVLSRKLICAFLDSIKPCFLLVNVIFQGSVQNGKSKSVYFLSSGFYLYPLFLNSLRESVRYDHRGMGNSRMDLRTLL